MSVPLPPGTGLEKLDTEQLKTFKEFLISYNRLSEMCFKKCVNDFTSRVVRPHEGICAVNCMEKFLKANQRMSQRFQEYQIIANENALAAAGKLGNVPG